jgi:outer membrane protein assembly factor BamB
MQTPPLSALFTISVDGKVDAEPLYIASVPISASGNHNLVIVATEHGTLYAFDADTGARIWKVTTLKGPEWRRTATATSSCSMPTAILILT